VSLRYYDTNSRESRLFRCRSPVWRVGWGSRLPAQTHSHCEIHRRQHQPVQVGEVGEFELVGILGTRTGGTQGKGATAKPGAKARGELRERRGKKPGLRPGLGRVQQPGLRPGPALAGLAEEAGRKRAGEGRSSGRNRGRCGRVHRRIRGRSRRRIETGDVAGAVQCRPLQSLARREM
jgi:hypothetical protein